MTWQVTMILVILIIIACFGAYGFIKLPKDKKIANVQEWLKWAVTEAERRLGSGTGQLKLRLVYDMAIEKFPWLISLVNFTDFSKMVDKALDWMRNQVETNNSAKEYVDNLR